MLTSTRYFASHFGRRIVVASSSSSSSSHANKVFVPLRLAKTTTSLRASLSTAANNAPPTKSKKDDKHVDPMEVFDQIDTNGDGVLSRDEFSIAVEKLNYQDLLKIKDSLARNELSYNPTADKDMSLEETRASVIGRRMYVTAEVAISKIFPAGFGWQTAAYLADAYGKLESTSPAFYLSTGIGDGLGVCMGHTLYMLGKKTVTGNSDIDMEKEFQTGIVRIV